MKLWVRLLLPLAVGLLVGFAIADEAHRIGINQLAKDKAELTKLDWILLRARVRSLEYKLAHKFAQPVSEIGMWYDKDHKKVVVSAFVSPEWLERTRVNDLKETFSSEAAEYCVDGFALAAGEVDPLAQLKATEDLKSVCTVHFFTWVVGKSGLERKDIARYEDAKLVLE